MDPVLSSLFPINQIGSDGFNWWIGQVESNKNEDPKNSGRYRVRIVGQHLKDCGATPTEELPWANVMMPVTAPFTDGGVTGATVDLRQGNWVIGFYMDADKQKPIIMGSVGHTAGATLVKNVEKDPNPGGNCKSFTTFFDQSVNPYRHLPLQETNKDNGSTSQDNSEYTTVGQAGQIASTVPGKEPASFYALFGENTATNPIGSKVCVEIANPKCGSENDLRSGLTKILGDMLAANQQSGGQLGDYYVSQVNGELTNYVDHGRKYVNKATRLVRSFISRAKGEIVNTIRQGVDGLVDLTLTADVPVTYSDPVSTITSDTTVQFEVIGGGTVDVTNFQPVSELDVVGPVDTNLDLNPIGPVTKKQSRLKPIIDTINTVLDDLGCSMEDITDQIAQWLTDLLLDFLMEAFNAATCLVDTLVEGIINQLLILIEDLLNTVLGPLQEIFALIASPLNIIGSAVNTVLSLLGISCDGPGAQCEKVTKECTDCGTDDTTDWLDDLINQIEDGPLAGTSVCDEAKEAPAPQLTEIVFVGGIFEPAEELLTDTQLSTVPQTNILIYTSSDIIVTEGQNATFTIKRSGNTTVSSSIKYETISGSAIADVDFIVPTTGGTIGFAPGETTKTITYKTLQDSISENTEKFFIKLSEASTPNEMRSYFDSGNLFECQIVDYTLNSIEPDQIVPEEVDDITKKPKPILTLPPVNTATQSVATRLPSTSTIPTLPKYNVTSDKSFYEEGEKIVYTITTENVISGTELDYTITGDVSVQDIVGGQLTGTVQIIDGSAQVEIELVVNDDIEEEEDASEIIVFSIDDTEASTTAVILGENTLVPFYSVSADKYSVNEGETITYTISTLNVPDNTVLNYSLSGDGITRTDIVEYELTGSFTVVENTAQVQIQIASDGDIEQAELLTFSIDGTNAFANVIINPDPLSEAQVEGVAPTFFVQSDKLVYDEGETAIFTVTTTNVPDGTRLQYTLFGSNITKSDIVGGTLFDNFVILSNTATVYVGINEDTNIESNETLTFIINGTGASAQILIVGDVDEEDPNVIDVVDPCINPPTAGAPITDENGAIISIPIVDRGCPYQKPPRVIITGRGYGSSAIPLLDENGYVSEIRITRTGRGYVKNLAEDVDLVCVIDSYTLLNPGRGYISEPDVYINGELGIARARINEAGYVYSVEVVNRNKNFKEIPKILIQGGGGFGARVLPSLSCLDKKELEVREYAKIGTGKYIDCP